VLAGGREVGYIQWYRVGDHPEAMDLFSLDAERADATAGIDFGLGEPEVAGKGLGRAVVRQFVRDVVLREPGIDAVLVDPDPDNKSAVRCYDAAGFAARGVVVDGKTGESWMVMEWAG
jgi:aminoglycoside 6'-N-acetyltransferase